MEVTRWGALCVALLGSPTREVFLPTIELWGDEAPRLGSHDYGDGRLDLVSSTSTEGFTAFLQESAGVFRPVPFTCPMQRTASNSLALHDFDGDGLLDVISQATHTAFGELPDDAALTIFLHGGLDASPCWETIVVDDTSPVYSHDLRLVDLDDDGNRDVVLNLDGELVVGYLAPQDPRDPWTRLEIGHAGDHGLDVGDLDGDGLPDVVAFDRVYLHPDDLVDGWQEVAYTENYQPSTIQVLDLDVDGIVDLTLAEGHDHRVGEGRVVALFKDDATECDPTSFTAVEIARVTHPEGIHSIDLSGDGVPDTTFFPAFEDFEWNANDGKGKIFQAGLDVSNRRVESLELLSDGWRGGHQLTCRDIDGDGDLDLMTYNIGAEEPDVASFVVFHQERPSKRPPPGQ